MEAKLLTEKEYKKRLKVIGCSKDEIKTSWECVERRRGIRHSE